MIAIAAADGFTVRLRLVAVALLLALASGCATNGTDPRDPIEGFNRAMYSFNEGFDDAIGKPVATAYRDVLPSFVRTGVHNFFANIEDLFIAVNNLLQAKPIDALTDVTRLAVNTTFGLLGLIDVASHMELEKHNEDFGQTFGRWGVGDGPYIVWPFLGSSTLRDSAGSVFDIYLDPVRKHRPVDTRNILLATRLVSKRADLLEASDILEQAALDKYVFHRDAHLQRRRSLIYDGNPPRENRSLGEERMGQVNEPASPDVAGGDGPRVSETVDPALAVATQSGADDAAQLAQPR